MRKRFKLFRPSNSQFFFIEEKKKKKKYFTFYKSVHLQIIIQCRMIT